MADITPIASLNGELAMPEKVWMQGPQGPKGDTGAAATVTVGTVTTGEPGTDAIVTNSGTESAAVLNFTIPRGESGSSVPKPLTYDYMPEGYPKKTMETVTIMEYQELAFSLSGGTTYMALLTKAFDIAEGQTYTVNWDGTEYECVCSTFNSNPFIGNLSVIGMGDDTGEPFIYAYKKSSSSGRFLTFDTSASHTISVKTTGEIITSIYENFLPTGITAAAIENAQTTANAAQTTANEAQTTANSALPKTGGAVSGNLTVDAKNDSYRTVISAGEMAVQYVNSEGTATDTVVISGRNTPSIVADKDGSSGFNLSYSGLSLGYTSKNNDGIHLYHSNGSSTAGEIVIQHTNIGNNAKERISIASTGIITCNNRLKFDCGSEIEVVQTYGNTGGSAIILRSSTADSTKRFRITVDDSGTISATEVT